MTEIFDPIHGPIEICLNATKIIDTPEFQRLRSIKQLGCCYYVFPGACHNRFEHSLGVYHLTKKYIECLGKENFTEREQLLVSIGGLIHDIGHGPFSHLFDELTCSHHEDRSIELFIYMNQKYNLNYSDEDIDCIKRIIMPNDLTHITKKYLYQIVSNKNGIDVDRFDYIMRDTKMIGLNYGIEWLRIMKGSKISMNEIVYSEKNKLSIEDFFRTRYILYKEVYHHRTVRSIEYMIKEIFKSMDPILSISDKIQTKKWGDFIHLHDSLIDVYSIHHQNDIVDRLKQRKLYKLKKEYICKTHEEIQTLKQQYVQLPYIIDESVIKYYESESPKYYSTRPIANNLIERENKSDTEYHLKIYES
jgi:deoxynucleoside triphosphate triphosphohydrolase SAMHD1